jgi:hypothetical protein
VHSIAKHLTFVATANAAGGFIIPLFISAGREQAPEKFTSWIGSYSAVTSAGSMEKHIFAEYAKLFVEATKPTPEDPVVLLFDNHKSHLDLEAIITLREAGVRVLALPPNTTHALCPLDVNYFGPLKTAFHAKVAHRKSIKSALKLEEVVEYFRQAFQDTGAKEIFPDGSVKPSKIMNAFKNSGIYPLDRTVVFPAPPAHLHGVPDEVEDVIDHKKDLESFKNVGLQLSPEARQELFNKALVAARAERPPRPHGKAGMANILSTDHYIQTAAQKLIDNVAKEAQKAENRKKRAEKKGRKALSEADKVQAYIERCNQNGGKRGRGRPPRGFKEDTDENNDGSEEEVIIVRPTKRRRGGEE